MGMSMYIFIATVDINIGELFFLNKIQLKTCPGTKKKRV
jgi:hypothetical protein